MLANYLKIRIFFEYEVLLLSQRQSANFRYYANNFSHLESSKIDIFPFGKVLPRNKPEQCTHKQVYNHLVNYRIFLQKLSKFILLCLVHQNLLREHWTNDLFGAYICQQHFTDFFCILITQRMDLLKPRTVYSVDI